MRSVLRDLSGINTVKDTSLFEGNPLGLNTADIAWLGLSGPGPANADPQLDEGHRKSNGYHHHIVVFLEVRVPYVPVPSTNVQAASSSSSGMRTLRGTSSPPSPSIHTSFTFVAPCGDQWHTTSMIFNIYFSSERKLQMLFRVNILVPCFRRRHEVSSQSW